MESRRKDLGIVWVLALGLMLFVGFAESVRAESRGVEIGLRRASYFAYYPSKNEIWVKIDFTRRNVRLRKVVELGKTFRSVAVAVLPKEGSSVLAETEIKLRDGIGKEFRLQVPDLAGKHRIRFVFRGVNNQITVTKSFERRKFVWKATLSALLIKYFLPLNRLM